MDTKTQPAGSRKNLAIDIPLAVFGAAGLWAFIWFWSSVPHVGRADAVVNDIWPVLAITRTLIVAIIATSGALYALAAYRRGCFVWRPALYLGIGLFLLTMSFRILSALLPADGLTVRTVASVVAVSFNAGVKVLAAVVIAGAVGAAMWRKLGAQRCLLWTPTASTWSSISLASLRGHKIAGVVLGMLMVIAIIAKAAGMTTAMVFPDAPAVADGGEPVVLYLFTSVVTAAVVLELTFRLFATGVFLTWTGRRWLAVVLASMVYALVVPTMDMGHGWLVSPAYLAVAIFFVVGVLFGALAIRFGTATTITASYLVTACVLAVPILRSGPSGATMALTIVVLTIPLLVALPGAFMALSKWSKERNAPQRPPVTVDIAGHEAVSKIAALREPRPGQPGPSMYLEDKSVLVLAARRADDFIGYIAVKKAEAGPSEILDLFVHEGERRQYIGTKLLHEAREILKVEGRRAIRATADESDLATRTFFDAAGLDASQVVVRTGA